MPLKEGEQVGPYRVVEQLGRGGMATVFKAYHANLDRYVALKVLHPAFMEDPNFEKRFQREAKVVAKLEHPNIIPVYDFADHDGQSYLVMKFVEGKTLKGRLNERPLTPDEGVKIIQAVGDGLSYAHKQGILHRDIKPSNVMLGDDGQVYLTDFGLARIASAGESTLSGDMMIGTPQYISPEQAMGKRDLDEGTDIYSFGVLTYELVVGQVPFASDTPFSVVHDHIYSPLPMPRTVNPNVPENIERILLKALAKERSDRFETVEEMVQAFMRAVKGEELPEIWVDPASQIAKIAQAETAIPTPVPSSVSAQDSGSTPPPISDTATLPPEGRKKGRSRGRWRRWMAIPLVMGLCFCLLVVFGALNDAQNSSIQFHETPGIFIEGLPGAEETPEVEYDTPLLQALDRVEQNSDDPYAYLELAAVFYDEGYPEQAREAYQSGREFAGNDPAFHETFGDMLAARELWQLAFEQYILAYQYRDGDLDNNFFAKVSKAAYFTAEDEDAEDFITQVGPQDDEHAIEIVQTVRARYKSLYGSPDEAFALISLILDENPENQAATLVLAEIHIIQGDTEDAVEILENLLENQN
jgi:serine/threonine protein kinase